MRQWGFVQEVTGQSSYNHKPEYKKKICFQPCKVQSFFWANTIVKKCFSEKVLARKNPNG